MAASACRKFRRSTGTDCSRVLPRSRGELPRSAAFEGGWDSWAVDPSAKTVEAGYAKRQVGPLRWKHPGAREQEQHCEGHVNPRSAVEIGSASAMSAGPSMNRTGDLVRQARCNIKRDG